MFFYSLYGLLVSLSYKMVMQQNIMLKAIRSILCLKHSLLQQKHTYGKYV